MKTYCKPAQVNIEDYKFNESAIWIGIDGKLGRKGFQRLLISTGEVTKEEIETRLQNPDNTEKVHRAIDEVVIMLTDRIRNRDLQLKPIIQSQRRDGLTGKIRDICRESEEQQLYEYIAVKALKPLFKAKLLPFQYGSVPGKGQVAGKRKIERILRRKLCNVTAVKGDVKKAYPSVTVECVMKLLKRDIRKNIILLWFLGALMANYPEAHLCIGGYLPCWLFNYVMSYVLRYLMEQKIIRREKSQKLVKSIVCYADDFTIFGYFSELKKAMKKATRWAKATLGITIKSVWQIYKVQSFENEKMLEKLHAKGNRKRTPGVDMMGFVVRRTYTIIRKRIFRRIRRQLLRAERNIKQTRKIPWWRAAKLMAYKGWIKHSDSIWMKEKYDVDNIMKMARKSTSVHGRKEYRNERKLLTQAA